MRARQGAGKARPAGGAGVSVMPDGGTPYAVRSEFVAICDRHGTVRSVDPEAARSWGVGDAIEAVGRRWDQIGLPGDVARAVGRGFVCVVNDGRRFAVEVGGEDDGPGRVVECRLTRLSSKIDANETLLLVLRDVTEARRVEKAVRESERRYRLIAENSTDMISLHDPAGAYLYVSPACKALTGFEPEQLVGRSAYEFIHPDDLAEVHRVHSTLLAEVDTFSVAWRCRRREGDYVWLETTTRALRDKPTGRVLEIQCATRDISRRKQHEQELRESRELLQAVLDNSPAIVYIKDVDGRLLLINRRFERLFNMSRRRVLGRPPEEIFPAEFTEAYRANDRKVIEARAPLEFEERVPQDDGVHTYVSVKFPLFDRENAVYAVCGISTDITARQIAETALWEQSEVLRSILDNMADAVIVADESEHFLVFNPAAERMFGRGATLSTSDEWSERYGLFLPDTVTPFPGAELPLARAVRGEATDHIEIYVRHAGNPAGSWVIVSGRPLRDENGQPRGGVVVCREITERKTAEEKLRQQNQKLQEAAEGERQAHEALKHAEVHLVQAEKLTALGQMVAGVAHEMNNPLAFVSNNLAVLERDVAGLRDILNLYRRADTVLDTQDPTLAAEIHAVAESIDLDYTLAGIDRLTSRSREGLRRIQQIVKDLRDFARLDDGDLQAVDLNIGVTSTVNMILGRAHKQEVEIDVDLNPHPLVTCYPGKINQVVMNLLSNAIDACGPNGKVSVRTEVDPGGEFVLIHVDDNGMGITPSARPRIFDPFFTTKPIGQGTGLGLSISYGIVQAHGGTITVDSEPGQGAKFTVKLPFVPQVPASGGGDRSGPTSGILA
jgi:two-component system, NtrC family, sensor kinase